MEASIEPEQSEIFIDLIFILIISLLPGHQENLEEIKDLNDIHRKIKREKSS